jgi:hypothetical protein
MQLDLDRVQFRLFMPRPDKSSDKASRDLYRPILGDGKLALDRKYIYAESKQVNKPITPNP